VATEGLILAVSSGADLHARAVLDALRARGAPAALVDPATFPTRARASCRHDDARGARWTLDGVASEDVHAVWLRRVTPPAADPDLDAASAAFARQEAQALLVNLLALAAPYARFINPPWAALANDLGHAKLAQLDAARACDLATPATLATNDPAAARAFVAENDARGVATVYKPFRSPLVRGEHADLVIYTARVDAAARERLDLVRLSPALLQEEIPKAREIRATVVGDRVFACAIDSQADAASELDWRLGQNPERLAPCALPEGVARRLVRLHERLGLVFGCADLIETPDGAHVFLETNQAGQWLWQPDAVSSAITNALCDLLLARS
jgi:glutathione synthase/RimK-type ligase-like ATP-grasp enzyme